MKDEYSLRISEVIFITQADVQDVIFFLHPVLEENESNLLYYGYLTQFQE